MVHPGHLRRTLVAGVVRTLFADSSGSDSSRCWVDLNGGRSEGTLHGIVATGPSLSEYLVPTHADIPHIDVHYLNDLDPTMLLGLLGIGEIGITGAAAAIANAVRHATGRRVVDLPITLDKVL